MVIGRAPAGRLTYDGSVELVHKKRAHANRQNVWCVVSGCHELNPCDVCV